MQGGWGANAQEGNSRACKGGAHPGVSAGTAAGRAQRRGWRRRGSQRAGDKPGHWAQPGLNRERSYSVAGRRKMWMLETQQR